MSFFEGLISDNPAQTLLNFSVIIGIFGAVVTALRFLFGLQSEVKELRKSVDAQTKSNQALAKTQGETNVELRSFIAASERRFQASEKDIDRLYDRDSNERRTRADRQDQQRRGYQDIEDQQRRGRDNEREQ